MAKFTLSKKQQYNQLKNSPMGGKTTTSTKTIPTTTIHPNHITDIYLIEICLFNNNKNKNNIINCQY